MTSWRPCLSMAAAAGHKEIVPERSEMAAGEPVIDRTKSPADLQAEIDELERRKRYAWLYDDEDIWASL